MWHSRNTQITNLALSARIVLMSAIPTLFISFASIYMSMVFAYAYCKQIKPMARHTSRADMPAKSVPCTYLKRNGSLCGKNCFGGICSFHARCAQHVACSRCGKGTHSVSGICSSSGCRKAQLTVMARTLRYERSLADSEIAAPNCELDALVDELLGAV